MSGHNKWSKIKNKKAVTDAAKSKVFSKYAHLIASESKKCGGDINSPGLRAVIDRARAENMPKDNIKRAVEKGASKDSASLNEVLYEFYGPAGTMFIVVAETDNANRTSQEMKHIISRNGFTLGTQGSVSWAFKREGAEWIPNSTMELSAEDKEKFDAFSDEILEQDDVVAIYSNESTGN